MTQFLPHSRLYYLPRTPGASRWSADRVLELSRDQNNPIHTAIAGTTHTTMGITNTRTYRLFHRRMAGGRIRERSLGMSKAGWEMACRCLRIISITPRRMTSLTFLVPITIDNISTKYLGHLGSTRIVRCYRVGTETVQLSARPPSDSVKLACNIDGLYDWLHFISPIWNIYFFLTALRYEACYGKAWTRRGKK